MPDAQVREQVGRRGQGAAHRAPAEEAAVGAGRRRHAARHDRPRAGAPAVGDADGRADRRARRQAARGDAHRAAPPARRERLDHRLRHARPGRGDGDGRQDRHHERRPAAAVRQPGHGVRRAGQPVRRAVRRQPDHERGRLRDARSPTAACACACPAWPSRSCCASRALRAQLLAAPAAAEGLALGVRPEAITVQLAPAPGLRAAPRCTWSSRWAPTTSSTSPSATRACARARTQPVRARRRARRCGSALDDARTHFFDKRSGLSLRAATRENDHGRRLAQQLSKHFGAVHAVRDADAGHPRPRVLRAARRRRAPARPPRLRCIAGLEQPQTGDILIAGERVNDWSAAQRDVALVFQQYSLYPNYTVRENLAFPLKSKLRNLSAQQIERARRQGRRDGAHHATCSSAAPTGCRAARCSASRSAAPSCASRACS